MFRPLSGHRQDIKMHNINMIKGFIRWIYVYIIINTYLATCFGTSEPSSGQFLIYSHDAFSECAHYWIPYCLQTILILKFKLKNLLADVSFEIYVKTPVSTLVNLY
jgi:hypothetical protein